MGNTTISCTSRKKNPYFKKKTNDISNALLIYALENDMLQSSKAPEQIIMDLREQILEEHKKHHSIWQGEKNRRWCTKIGEDSHQISRKEYQDLENAIIEYYLSKSKLNMSVQEVFEDWLKYELQHNEHTMKTINEYSFDFRKYVSTDSLAGMPLSAIRESDIVKFMKRMVYDAGEKVPKKRYACVKTILRHLFNYAKIHLDIECISIVHIMEDIKFPAGAFKQRDNTAASQVFKLSEITAMKAKLGDTQEFLELGILLTIDTGLRVGELCALKREDFTGRHLLIRRSEHKAKFETEYRYFIGEPKKNKHRMVVLSPEMQELCRKILSWHNSEWFFPNDDADGHMHVYHFDRRIRRVCREMKIPVRSMHKLRKTYASFLLANNVDEKLVQEQLGHADISTTRQAYYYNIFDVDEEYNILSSLAVG